MKKVKENYVFYAISQIFLMIFPLITFPYVSSTLGVDNYGIYSYSYAILTYFLIFAKLGILNYGTREIAENNRGFNTLSKKFNEIYMVQFLLTSIIIIIYIIFCLIFFNEELIFNLCFLLLLVANYFDIAWFFQGIQGFKMITLRNLFINLVTLPCVFLLLKDSSDLIIYTLIVGSAQIIGNFLVCLRLKKYIKFKFLFKKVNFKVLKKHILGMALLFVPILTSQIYSLMDELMLGNLSVYGEVGLYSCAKKIIWIPLAIVTPLSMALLPYLSEKQSMGKKINKGLKDDTFLLMIWLSSACVLGLIYIAPTFFELFFSKEYSGAVILTQIMAIYFLFNVVSIFLRDVYFLPNHIDSLYIKTVYLGIPINIILNLILIPKYNALGAVLSTLVAEVIICIVRLFLIRKLLNIKYILKNSIYFIISSFIMYGVIILIEINTTNMFINLICNVIICVIIYLILTGYKVIKIFKNI